MEAVLPDPHCGIAEAQASKCGFSFQNSEFFKNGSKIHIVLKKLKKSLLAVQ